jgi:hypothetical protein
MNVQIILKITKLLNDSGKNEVTKHAFQITGQSLSYGLAQGSSKHPLSNSLRIFATLQ